MYVDPIPRSSQPSTLFYDSRWLLAYWRRWNLATLFFYLLVMFVLIAAMMAALLDLFPRAVLPLWEFLLGLPVVLAIGGSWWTHKIGILVRQPQPVVVMTAEALIVHDPLRGMKAYARWRDIVNIDVQGSSVMVWRAVDETSSRARYLVWRSRRGKQDVVVSLVHLERTAGEIRRTWKRYQRVAEMNGKGNVYG